MMAATNRRGWLLLHSQRLVAVFLLFPVLVLAGSLDEEGVGDRDTASAASQPDREYNRVLQMFGNLGLPETAGAPFVQFLGGTPGAPRDRGWLLQVCTNGEVCYLPEDNKEKTPTEAAFWRNLESTLSARSALLQHGHIAIIGLPD
jgi:hypothetical protein